MIEKSGVQIVVKNILFALLSIHSILINEIKRITTLVLTVAD